MQDCNARKTNLGQLLLRAFHWFDDGLLARLHSGGWLAVTRAHSMIFAHLDADGTRPSELARRIGVTRQAVHQTVNELIDMGLVQLSPDPTNRKAKLVALTSQGKENVKAALEIFTELEDQLSHRIGPEQVENLRQALESDWGPPTQHTRY